jgi:hypothetical protein
MPSEGIASLISCTLGSSCGDSGGAGEPAREDGCGVLVPPTPGGGDADILSLSR